MSNPAKILLVEDDTMVIKMYTTKLTKEGFILTSAGNGEEGLAALEKELPDIVLLDIMMPKMNGLEMLRIVRSDEKFKDIPVVMLTNLGDRDEDVERCKELGAQDYWIKANLSLNELSEKIKNILK
jgi:Response regulators consisting of a CheY-like receiver domain and a winged-helix DNA-binding domain